MPGIVAPKDFPIRDPRNPKQEVGRIVNPVGYMEVGGLDGPGKWGKGTTMKVEKPTSVQGAKTVHNSSDD